MTRRSASEERLTIERIVDAALTLAEREGAGVLTMRRIGAELGVDATATYRYFSDKDALVRAMGDRVIGEALDRHQPTGDWIENLRSIMTLTYESFCRRPSLTLLVTQSPPRQSNELRLTELILAELEDGGFDGRERALAYHSLVELTVGVAVIDSQAASAPEGTEALYESWRASYRAQSPVDAPATSKSVDDLYSDDAEQFSFALGLLLDGLSVRSPKRRRVVKR